MGDLVKRLHFGVGCGNMLPGENEVICTNMLPCARCQDRENAADEIERLREIEVAAIEMHTIWFDCGHKEAVGAPMIRLFKKLKP